MPGEGLLLGDERRGGWKVGGFGEGEIWGRRGCVVSPIVRIQNPGGRGTHLYGWKNLFIFYFHSAH